MPAVYFGRVAYAPAERKVITVPLLSHCAELLQIESINVKTISNN